MSIRFAAVGLNHPHIFGMADQLLSAGASLAAFYAQEPALAAQFHGQYPQARRAQAVPEILEDPSIQLIISAAIPDQRAALAMEAMRHGKDFLSAKPGSVSEEEMQLVREVQAATRRIYAIYFSERFASPVTLKASELVEAGAIGTVVQTTGMGPHRVNVSPRDDWFFDVRRSGGILNDLASHQVDQFLHFTSSFSAEIVASQVANFHHPRFPRFQDFGDLMLRSPSATGYIRVDWLAPDGLSTWGDVRLFILGTEGYIELRKNQDLAGRPGGEHLFLVNQRGVQYLDCTNVPLTFARRLIEDILNRTETAVAQAHTFRVSELTLQAQARARRFEPTPHSPERGDEGAVPLG